MLEKITDHCSISADIYNRPFYFVYVFFSGEPFLPDLKLRSEAVFDKGEAITWCRELESRLFLHEEDI